MIFVDTDVMIDLLRQYPPAVAWLSKIGDEEIVLPGFVVMELIQGCRNRVEEKRLEKEIKSYGVVWPSPAMCDEALAVFVHYHRSHGLGILDALIGQMAVRLNVSMHTFNQSHYESIPNLKTVQPYEKSIEG